MVRNVIRFYGEEFLAFRPTPKLQDHPFSAVRDSLFNIFAATLHTGSRSSIRSLRMPHGVEREEPAYQRELYTEEKLILRPWF